MKILKFILAFFRGYDTFTGLLVLAFLCLGLVGIVNHEMWLDELQAWVIARDSSSVIDLFKNLEYEGHPGLWHIGLYLISRFTANPVSMQIFHLMLATGVIYVFAKFSPFTRLQKVLFSFGYFSFYEYSIISRNYALGVLFIFLFCALYTTKNRTYILLACTLCLLSNTNLYGLIIAVAFGLALLLERLLDVNQKKILKSRKWDLIISVLIVLFGIVVSIIQILPPSDASFSPGWTTDFQIERLAKVIVTIGKTYLPLPNFFTYQFWNTSLLTAVKIVAGAIGTVFSLGLLTFTLIIFIQKPVVIFMYITGTFGILSFMYFKHIGSMRHCGHLFIFFIACLRISNYYDKSNTFSNFMEGISQNFNQAINSLNNLLKSYQNTVIAAILYTHVVAGVFAFTMDLYYPFSVTKEIARFIVNQHMEDILVVGDVDYINYVGPSLSGYLGKQVYYLGAHNSGLSSFLVWDGNRQYIRALNSYNFFDNLDKYMKEKNKEVLLVLNHELKTCKNIKRNFIVENTGLKIDGFVDYCWQADNYLASKVSEFKKGLIPDENPGFYLYIIQSRQKR